MDIDFFTNDRYKVLFCLYERQIEVNGKLFTPLSQEQISEIIGISKVNVNNIIKELKSEGYVIQESKTRGKYILTNKSISLILQIESKGAVQ